MLTPTTLGFALAVSGLPVVMANLLAPSPIFGDQPVRALGRIASGLGVTAYGIYLLA